MVTVKEIFASNLKRIRKNMGLSQEKFAEKVGIQARNLTDIENAKYMPTPANIDKICMNLNIPQSVLFKMPQEFITNEKSEIINQINEILSIMDKNKLQVIHNIIIHAFDNCK